jgi:two-component system sensor histidine kinase CreC
LASISDQAKRLQLLIEKMLQQASLETRQVLDNAEAVNLAGIVHEAVGSVAPRLEKKQLQLQLSMTEKATVRGDAFLLQQAIVNLLENAADFSHQAGTLYLSLEDVKGKWCLRLRDQGPGIPDYAQSRVFERYYSLPRPEGGAKSTGLGLSFVKQVMDLHQGRVALANHPEGGAEACLYFPVFS